MPRFSSSSSSPVIASAKDSRSLDLDQQIKSSILPPREAINYIVTNTFFGSTDKIIPKPRQNLAYTCMTALASLSSSTDQPESITALATDYITLRVALVLYMYITDHPLRGNLPMPKIQRRELVRALELILSITQEGALVPLFPLIVRAIPIAENDKPILDLLQRLLLKIGKAQNIHF